MPMSVTEGMRRMQQDRPFGFMLYDGVWAVNPAGAADREYLARIQLNYPEARIVDWDKKQPIGNSLARCMDLLAMRKV